MLPLRVRLGYGLCAVLIAASLAVIVWKGRPLLGRGEAPARRSPSPEAVASLLARSFQVNEGRSLRLADLPADYLVIFLFTPGDCAACLPEMRDLNRLAGEHGAVAAVAVMSYSNFDEARQTRENFGLSLPIAQDPQGEVLDSIAPPSTPWKLVVQRKDGRLLLEEGRTVTADQRAAFLARVRRQTLESLPRSGAAGG